MTPSNDITAKFPDWCCNALIPCLLFATQDSCLLASSIVGYICKESKIFREACPIIPRRSGETATRLMLVE
jgi:hypothetical protein